LDGSLFGNSTIFSEISVPFVPVSKCLKFLIDWKALNHSTKSSGNFGEREVKSNGNSEGFDRMKSAQPFNEILGKFRESRS